MGLTPIAQLIEKASPSSVAASAFAVGSMGFLLRVRKVWLLTQKVFSFFSLENNTLALDVDYLKKDLVGRVIFQGVGGWKSVRAFARFFLCAHSIFACIEREKSLIRTYRDWKKFAWQGDYERHIILKISTEKTSSHLEKLLPLSCVFWIRWKRREFLIRMEKIVLYTGRLFKDVFLFVMAYVDVYDAFSLSNRIGNRAVKELAINFSRVMDNTTSSKGDFLDFLKDQERVTSEIITLFQLPFTAQQLQDSTASFFDAMDYGYSNLKKIAATADKSLFRFVSSGISALWFGSGLNQVWKIPPSLLPSDA